MVYEGDRNPVGVVMPWLLIFAMVVVKLSEILRFPLFDELVR